MKWFKEEKQAYIDWDKVNTFEELQFILKHIPIKVEGGKVEELKDYIKWEL